jgi:RES domain-containing protein
MRKVRDPELIERLQRQPTQPLHTKLWRITRAGRDPLLATSPKGRWDDGSFDVLYTALEPDTARAELHWHLSRSQPVFPSALKLHLHELELKADAAVTIASLSDLTAFGIDTSRYGSLDFARLGEEYALTQKIGEAANFLGHDALIVPSARWPGHNLVVLTAQLADNALMHIQDHGAQELRAWATDHKI